MKRIGLVFATVASMAFAGCATVDTQQAAQNAQQPAQKQEGSLVTGSRLPHGSSSVRVVDQKNAEEMMRNQGHIPGPGGG